MRSEIKGLILTSVIYGIGDILLKAFNFLLLPIYTRLLTPSDYGILAVTGFLSFIMSIFMSLSLHGFLTPLYFSTGNYQERRENIGSLFLLSILVGGVIALSIDQVARPLFSLVIRDVPFDPYIRLTIWTAYLSTWSRIPLLLLRVQERSFAYVLLTLSSSLLQIVLSIWFVVYLQRGIEGLLIANLIATFVTSVICLISVSSNMILSFKVKIWRQALIFSLPLIPHELSGWILELSDRAILQWYVPLDQVGIYSLAYSYGSLITLIGYAMNMAWVPFLHKTDSIEGERASERFSYIATYFTALLCFFGLFLGLAAKPVISLITTALFHHAGDIAPWIVAALLLSSIYYFPVNFIFLRRKTVKVAFVTVVSSLTNIILNLWLIPMHGVMAAAWTTFISYGVMTLLTWYFSLKVYPIFYQYRRLMVVFLISAFLWVIGVGYPWNGFWSEIIGKLILLVAFPILLIIFGFFTEKEKSYLRLALRSYPIFQR